jgi:hypothetical protein
LREAGVAGDAGGMLFRSKDLEAIAAGTCTTAFRRWKRPTVRVGGTIRTAIGLIAIDSIEEIDPVTLSEADAASAGYPSLKALHAMFDSQEGVCYRIRLHPAGPDPRDALRESADLSGADRTAIATKLAKLDKAAPKPWTAATLQLIDANPGVVSTRLADQLGMERPDFKDNVRKLKALGLTISLDIGYRLSPRGEAFRKG